MVATLIDRDVLRVTGSDAAAYLQGQISQDVDALAVGDAAWSLVLEPTGRLAGWFRLHRLAPDEFLIDTDAGAADALVARIERFRLRNDVKFEPDSGWSMLSLRGDSSKPLDVVEGIVVAADWPGFEGTDVLGPDLGVPDAIAVDAEAFEEARIRAGVPRMGVDLDADTIPGEGGASLIERSVSFTKGCYTGQELVARIDSRGGQVPRPLRVLSLDGPVGVGAAIVHAGAEVGRVTSSAGTFALGPVMRKVEPGSAVEVGGVAGVVDGVRDR